MWRCTVRGRLYCGEMFPVVVIFAFFYALPAFSQDAGQGGSQAKNKGSLFNTVFDYLNVANQGRSLGFQPLTQKERSKLFAKSFINPVWYAKGAASAGANQWADVPEEWEQGGSGYGKRFGDIMGQYAIRRTLMYGMESLTREDNRYFGSEKKHFWPRVGYSLSSGILARHKNGRRYPSASLLFGYAGGAYLSRFWQPASSNSVGDAAVSFGISMGWNIGLGVVKEFLPDILHRK